MIRYAIIEDNPFAVEHLKQMIMQLRRDWELVFSASSVAKTTSFLQSGESVDLIFMDIELSDDKCFAIFDHINTVVPIIFTTAYDSHAIRAFKVNAVDYLLKPVDTTKLLHAIDKFECLFPNVSANTASAVSDETTDRILTVSGDKYNYVNISEVSYFISEDHCVLAILGDGTRRMTNFPNLTELEATLTKKDFFRISRNVIVSIGSIIKVSKYFKGRLLVTISSGTETLDISVPASRRDSFLSWLGK